MLSLCGSFHITPRRATQPRTRYVKQDRQKCFYDIENAIFSRSLCFRRRMGHTRVHLDDRPLLNSLHINSIKTSSVFSALPPA